MTDLKLIALDAEDLDVISATTQDAIIRTAELGYARADKRFALLMNRFAWEAGQPRDKTGIRKRTALHFDHVNSVKAAGFDPAAPEGTLELLTIRFVETDSPSGHVDLAFAGGGTVRLEVDVLEARLADLGAAWGASSKPTHAL